MLKGKHLPHKYAVLLDSVEAEASYCCVKGFVRDTALQQPPVYLSPAGRHTVVLTSQPRELIAKKEMSEDEIKSCLKLANLCKTKYEMPDAHDALRKFVRERHYEAARYAWLARPQDATYGVVHTMQHTAANVHFPYLPDRTWEMCARVSWSTCLGWCRHLHLFLVYLVRLEFFWWLGVLGKQVLQQTWQFNANVICFQLSFACCFAPACMSLLMVT